MAEGARWFLRRGGRGEWGEVAKTWEAVCLWLRVSPFVGLPALLVGMSAGLPVRPPVRLSICTSACFGRGRCVEA